jgi:hypothetical protein
MKKVKPENSGQKKKCNDILRDIIRKRTQFSSIQHDVARDWNRRFVSEQWGDSILQVTLAMIIPAIGRETQHSSQVSHGIQKTQEADVPSKKSSDKSSDMKSSYKNLKYSIFCS